MGAIPHVALFPDFKDSPGEKELFSSAEAYCFVTLLCYSQKPSTSVATVSNPLWGELSWK